MAFLGQSYYPMGLIY